MEVDYAPGPGARQHGRHEGLPEFRVDMPRRVNPKAIDPIAIDPRAIDVDETLYDPRALRHQVIQPAEIAKLGGFSLEGRIAAVVLINGIVQPRRHFDVFLSLRDVRGLGT